MQSCFCQVGSCVLCEAELHSEVSSEQVCQIRGLLSKHSYDAHEIIFRESDPGAYLFLVREGHIKLTASNPDGREQIIGLGLAGHVIGFDTMDDEAYTHTAETLTPADVCTIRRKDMLQILEQNPGVSMRLVEILNDELRQAKTLIRVLGQKSPAGKIATFILSLFPQRGAIPRELVLPLSREEVAEMVGLTEETVSRVMADLRRKGVIEAPRGFIRIIDHKRIFSLAGISAPAIGLASRFSFASQKA